MTDAGLRVFLADLMSHDVAPLLPPAPGIDIPSYKRTLLRRFANPKIGDPLARLCGRGSTKMPSYLLPSINEAALCGRPHPRLTLAVAAWFRFLRGTDCAGREIEVRDGLKDELQALARAGGNDPRPLLSRRSLFGNLSENETFVGSVERALVAIDGGGVTAAVAAELTAEIERAA
jgi:fructuronate reductase/mannitol 2-dehydrogenase